MDSDKGEETPALILASLGLRKLDKSAWIYFITCSYTFEKLKILGTSREKDCDQDPCSSFFPQSKFGVLTSEWLD